MVGYVPVSKNGLFKLRHVYALMVHESSDLINLYTLHWKLGHLSPGIIRMLMNANAIIGYQLIDDLSPFSCDACAYAKTTHKHISKLCKTPVSDSFGLEIHSDLWGPAFVDSLGKRRYYVTFIDDCTRYTHVEFLKTKDETFWAYKAFAAWAFTQHGKYIQRLRLDRGGEYLSEEFSNFLREQGTERRLTTANTPQHNGVAESLNR